MARHRILAMGLAGFVGSFLGAWWLVGERSEGVDPPMVDLSALEDLGGWLGLPGIVLALLVLAHAGRSARRAGDIRALVPALTFVLLGAFYGLGARIVSMETTGANVGGGAFLLVGVPAGLLLAAAVLVGWWRSSGGWLTG